MRETFYKTLRLVLPECANRLGIPAEAPTFLSPVIDMRRFCLICRGTYTPLVYQTGVVTHAHHYHPTAGGIYFFVTCRPPFTNWLIERTGWIAEVEPIGKISTQCISGDTCGRAEGVRTTRIVAYCMHRATSTGGPATHPSGLIALEQGILLSRPPNNSKWRRLSSDTKPGDLLPLCNSHELQPMEDAPFSFRVQDGTVFYSRPAVP